MTFSDQLEKMRSGQGFIAALDQSGGSTPKALELYGVPPASYANEAEMFDQAHEMRSRIITDPAFHGGRILGAILFEDTMHREVDGQPTAHYLWSVKRIVPFLKVDRGLQPEANGVQMMNPIPELGDTLQVAQSKAVFGTKMRSVIKRANAAAIDLIVAQQFDVARSIVGSGLVPIIEPEVDIHSVEKEECESLLLASLLRHLETLKSRLPVMFKLTLPTRANLYRPLTEHEKVLRVVALSGGYSREQADALLQLNDGVIASFSRALTEGLRVDMTSEQFSSLLDRAIEEIAQASG